MTRPCSVCVLASKSQRLVWYILIFLCETFFTCRSTERLRSQFVLKQLSNKAFAFISHAYSYCYKILAVCLGFAHTKRCERNPLGESWQKYWQAFAPSSLTHSAAWRTGMCCFQIAILLGLCLVRGVICYRLTAICYNLIAPVLPCYHKSHLRLCISSSQSIHKQRGVCNTNNPNAKSQGKGGGALCSVF